jgi:hypothetical protein
MREFEEKRAPRWARVPPTTWYWPSLWPFWEAEKGLFGIDVDDSLVVSTIRPFSVSAEDLYSLDDPYYRW